MYHPASLTLNKRVSSGRTCPTTKCLMTKALRLRLSKIVSTTKPIGDVVGDCAEGTKGKAAPENPEEQRLMRAFEKVLVE